MAKEAEKEKIIANIGERYQQFVAIANKLGDEDLKKFPLDKKGQEIARDRMERHLIGMIEMYSLTFGEDGYVGAWSTLKLALPKIKGLTPEQIEEISNLMSDTEDKYGISESDEA